VVLGEYNSGKTAVADLLIGHGLLPTSVISNTRVPVQISYASRAALYGIDGNGAPIRIDGDRDDPLTDLTYRAVQINLPLPWLKHYQILDTPPLATPKAFVAEADIVLWCSVASRAWTESERAVWSALPARCFRNAIFVATHKDSIETQDECLQVVRRLQGLTRGFFRDIVLVSAAGPHEGEQHPESEALTLRQAIDATADDIMERKLQKAGKIVRRLARLAFHDFGKAQVRPETVSLLASWELHTRGLIEQLARGQKSAQATIEASLMAYAAVAERLRPGVVIGDGIPHSSGRALTAPMRWPAQPSAAVHLVRVLISDLTGLLRILAGSSIYVDPAVRRDYQAARTVMLSLADLDGAFDALGRMLGSTSTPGPA
jgi:hypothetical protein